MLQVARLAPRVLGDSATRVQAYFQEQFNDDGGARDRAGDSDLYYTVFALDGLMALQADPPVDKVAPYLTSFEDGTNLDLVHLACLARCWAAMPAGALPPATASAIARNLERFRTPERGFSTEPGGKRGTVYHAFLGLGAHQDIGSECPDVASLADSVTGLQTRDGAFANTPDLPTGSTTATAAAVTLLRFLQHPMPEEIGPWLLARAHEQGGFLATTNAPLPDLLSTATALHALSGLHVDFSSVVEPCLDFVDSLWTGQAFCGHWGDDHQDSEYTFYALLALGHLSL